MNWEQGTSTMDRPRLTINLNTIIGLVSLSIIILGGVSGGSILYAQMQAQDEAWVDFQKRQEAYNTKLETDRAAGRATYDLKIETLQQAIGKLTSVTETNVYQIAQLQKKDEENDNRLGRMTESYGNRFTEIQTSLANMNTQLALLSQSMQEIKQIIAPSMRMPPPIEGTTQ